jgi:hypothetical protein
MAKKHIKKCSPSLLEWLPSRTQTTNVGEDVGKRNLHALLMGM